MATRSRMKHGYSTLALTLGQRWVVDSSTEGLRRVAHPAQYFVPLIILFYAMNSTFAVRIYMHVYFALLPLCFLYIHVLL